MLMDEYRSPWRTPEVEQFQETARRFWTAELIPHVERWEAQGHIDRGVWRRLGEMGFLLADLPSGCRFHPRCDRVFDRCTSVRPDPSWPEPGHMAACHRALGDAA